MANNTVTIQSEELKVLYDVFLALWNADHRPTKKSAKKIKEAYVNAALFYDNHPRKAK